MNGCAWVERSLDMVGEPRWDRSTACRACIAALSCFGRTDTGLRRGWGEFGRLGHGDTTSHREPAALTNDVLQGATMISCGGHHTVAVTETGHVVSWGWGSDGQLGNGNKDDQMIPTLVKALSTQRVIAVSCGYYHTAVVTEEGAVLCWGKGSSGQLGLGDASGCLIPRSIAALHEHKIREVSCGMAHTLVLSDEGLVFAWGAASDGQLGVGECPEGQADAHEPLQVLGVDTPVSLIAAGSRHSLCITRDDARLYAWGNNSDGRLGLEDCQNRFLPVAPPLCLDEHGASMRVSGISGGGHHSAVIEESLGRLYTCGKGSYGQLGHGDTEAIHSFKLVEALREMRISKIACGDTHTVALAVSGDVWVWGAGEDGQLGLPESVCETRCCVPRPVQKLQRKVCALAAGLVHSAALAPQQSQTAARISQKSSI
jgi:X-linked retinitis pigmentosa GTPase regulator